MNEERIRFVVSGLAAAYDDMPTDDITVKGWVNVFALDDEDDVRDAVKRWLESHISEWPSPAQIAHLIVLKRDLAPRMRERMRQEYEAQRGKMGLPASSRVFHDRGVQ